MWGIGKDDQAKKQKCVENVNHFPEGTSLTISHWARAKWSPSNLRNIIDSFFRNQSKFSIINLHVEHVG